MIGIMEDSLILEEKYDYVLAPGRTRGRLGASIIHRICEADSGESYTQNPLLEVLYSGEYSEEVEGPIAQGYIADSKAPTSSYITLPNVA